MAVSEQTLRGMRGILHALCSINCSLHPFRCRLRRTSHCTTTARWTRPSLCTMTVIGEVQFTPMQLDASRRTAACSAAICKCACARSLCSCRPWYDTLRQAPSTDACALPRTREWRSQLERPQGAWRTPGCRSARSSAEAPGVQQALVPVSAKGSMSLHLKGRVWGSARQRGEPRSKTCIRFDLGGLAQSSHKLSLTSLPWRCQIPATG